MTIQSYEIYIANEKHDLCKSEIEQKYSTNLSRVFSDSKYDNTNFKNFYTFSPNIGTENKWDAAKEILKISGVQEVEPILQIFGPFNKVKYYDEPLENPGWNIGLTRFDKAVQASRNQGKLGDTTDITIVQLDTGYTEHPEIKDRINKERSKNFYDSEINSKAVDNLSNNFADENPSHGTSTAGVIIGGNTGEAYDFNNGVFPYVNFIPYRISPSVIQFLNDRLYKPLIDAIDNSCCDIITMSMGGIPLPSWEYAVKRALEKGIIFVAAAGNDVGMVVYPARFNQVIAVGAVSQDSNPWAGSCRGPEVCISAPGHHVYVPFVPEKNKYLYTHGSGTSFATPHVAAAAALWLNHFRDELNSEYFKNNPHEKVLAFRQALVETKNVPSLWDEYKRTNFSGILNAEAILSYSPGKYLSNKPNASFRENTLRNFAISDRLPSSEDKELMHLIGEANIKTKEELYQYIKEKASKPALERFNYIYQKNEEFLSLYNKTFSNVVDNLNTSSNEIKRLFFQLLQTS
jgi:subtilisin family serine protease